MLDIDKLDPDALRRLCRDLLAENEQLKHRLAEAPPVVPEGEQFLARVIRACTNQKACE